MSDWLTNLGEQVSWELDFIDIDRGPHLCHLNQPQVAGRGRRVESQCEAVAIRLLLQQPVNELVGT
jgi:hypothetical protein